ncbi:MAG: electron transfer flavoprotein alpha subunit, partial [Maricaulis maris]
MAVLVIAEHDNATLNDATRAVVTAAKGLGGDIHVLVAGSGAQAVADAAAKLDGVAKVLHAESDVLAKPTAEALDALVTPLMADYDAVLAAATTSGKNFMPRVAAKLDVMQISEISEVVAPDTFVRPVYAGNAMMTVKSSDAKKVITV